jgi:tetratricopeptide (TPR) repeat protein
MEAINSIFDRLEAQGIDTKQEFLYGYFFCRKNKSQLESLKQVLVQRLFSFVEIRKDEELFVLHTVEKIKRHTRESLFATKQNFIKLAEHDGIFYDGFDVGNIDPAKPLISNKNFQKLMITHNDDDLFQLSIKLYDLEIYDKAKTVFLECLKKNINPDVVSYKLGNVTSWQGDTEGGIKYLEQAVKLNPNYLDAWFNPGAICYDNDLFEESIKYYRQADKLNPNDEDIVYGIAASQFAIAQFDESLENC